MIKIIIKHRDKPGVLLAYEALLRRLKPAYRNNDIINTEHQNYSAGFWGEENVDYWLSLYPQTDLFILEGLRLKGHQSSFQLDTLILTEKFICILEVKNMKGELLYDSRQQQLIQKVDNKKISYQDPILQAKAQKTNLTLWLKKRKVFSMPIEAIVVSSNPNTIITNVHEDPNIYKKLIHVESLHHHLDKLFQKHHLISLQKNEVYQLGKLLRKSHTPFLPNLVKRFHINENHLITGVPCSQCHYYPLIKTYIYWDCPKCNFRTQNAHIRTILDHFLLFKRTITNAESRHLLQIHNENVTYRILKSMNLKYDGRNKGRKYFSPDLKDFPQNSTLPNQQKSIFDRV